MATFSSPPPPSALFSPGPRSSEPSVEMSDVRSVENPFLVRGTPIVSTNQSLRGRSGRSPGAAAIAAKSPAVAASPAAVTALAVVPTNELRNRKACKKPLMGPPKSSLYMGADYGGATASAENMTPTTQKYLLPASSSGTDGNWVLIYGYTTHEQCRALLDRFSAYGTILELKRPNALVAGGGIGAGDPHNNWLALRYESRLQAEEALCHDHFQLRSGIFCGVKRLADTDPILLYRGNDANDSTTDRLEHTSDMSFIPVGADGVTSDDERLTDSRPQSVCEQFFRWLLSIH